MEHPSKVQKILSEAEQFVEEALDGRRYFITTDQATGRSFFSRFDRKPMTDIGQEMALQEYRLDRRAAALI